MENVNGSIFNDDRNLRLYHSPDYSYTVVFDVQSSIDFEKKKLYILIFK